MIHSWLLYVCMDVWIGVCISSSVLGVDSIGKSWPPLAMVCTYVLYRNVGWKTSLLKPVINCLVVNINDILD